jgi:hypothetical protein
MRSAALSYLARAAPTRLTGTRLQLFLNDFGVLDHCDAAAFGQFPFYGDIFTAVVGQLIVDWLVFANDQIRFALADNADRPASFDAFGPAGLAMFFADGIVIDVAHHIDHFAGHFFGCSRVAAVLVFLRNRQRRARQTRNEDRSHRNFQGGGFIIR